MVNHSLLSLRERIKVRAVRELGIVLVRPNYFAR
jgi:hypothetical protein